MLDPLIDGENRDVTGSSETTGIEERLEIAQHARRPVRRRHDAIDEVGTGQMKLVLRNRAALIGQQRRVTAKQALDAANGFSCCNSTYCSHLAPPTVDPTTGNWKSSTTASAAALSTISSIGSA